MATGNANANDNVVTTALNGRCKRGLRWSSRVLKKTLQAAQQLTLHAAINCLKQVETSTECNKICSTSVKMW